MSNQLYGDMQTMIKNVVFTIAKQQQLDPDGKVNANEDGTDPVENHFAFMWQKESRHHKITRTADKDHISTVSWQADLRAANCNIVDNWVWGAGEAVHILGEYSKLNPTKYYFPALFSTPGLDMSQPWGDGIYPGLLEGADQSQIQPACAPPLTPLALLPDNTLAADTQQVSDEEDNEESDPEDEIIPEIEPITFMDLVGNEPAPLQPAAAPGVRPNNYLADENGKFIHKAMVCHLVLNKEFVAKSKDRQGRAAGLGLKNHAKIVSLAVLRSTAIQHDTTRVSEIATITIGNSQANVKVIGQILHLKAVAATADDFASTKKPQHLWKDRKARMKKTEITTTKPLTFTVPGVMLELINPGVVDAHNRLSVEGAKGINSSGTTWALPESSLQLLMILLAKKLDDPALFSSLPIINLKEDNIVGFPYKSSSGQCYILFKALI
ncbi:hypothetical protein K438DRAFT_1929913 [Mycena galopus ATCC 62051]|nr:hypothetical protein K438DRAFT_1929913 [Mycena galopus ATCC 62051]